MSARNRRLVLAIYGALLLGLTLAPSPGAADVLADFDKWIHAALFGGLAALLVWCLDTASRLPTAILIAAAAAALVELLQAPIPYRSSDVGDVIAGTTGALVGAAVAFLVFRKGESGG